jgi:hypothetical protein
MAPRAAAPKSTRVLSCPVRPKGIVGIMGPVYPSRACPAPGSVAGMAEVLLFHHALGLTDGVRALAFLDQVG